MKMTLKPSWVRPGRPLTESEADSLEEFETWWTSDPEINYFYDKKWIARTIWMAARGFSL